MDLFVPLPKTANGNRHVFLITNRYTKMCRAILLQTAQAPQAAPAFLYCNAPGEQGPRCNGPEQQKSQTAKGAALRNVRSSLSL